MAEQLDQPLSRSRSQWMRWFHPARASRSDGFGRFAEATAPSKIGRASCRERV